MLCTWRDVAAARFRFSMVGMRAFVAFVAFGVAVFASAAARADGYTSILSGPPQPLTEILPKSALESIEPPAQALRVATRVEVGSSQRQAPEPLAAGVPAVPAADSSGEPLKLVAPTAPPKAEPDAGVLLSSPRRPAPSPMVLPLQAPRGRAISPPQPSNESGRDTRLADESNPAAPLSELRSESVDPPASEPDQPAFVDPIDPKPIDARPVDDPVFGGLADDTGVSDAEPGPKPDEAAGVDAASEPDTSASRRQAKGQATPEPKDPPPPLTRSLRNLRSRMRTVLSYYYARPLNTAEHDPWELMHGMLAYELHSRVRDGGPRGPFLTSVGHLCFNRPSEGKRMMVVRDDGSLDVEVGVSLQGHRGQFLAMLAQCNVSPDYPIRVDDRELTIHDLIKAEQRTCYAKTELTFKLIGLGHYLDSGAEWFNDRGEAWDIPRLIAEERAQPIRGAACGGTHRLAGLSLAYRRREARGEPVDGEYAEAAKFVAQYQSYAFRLQNEDGSLSTEWFRGRGDEEDIDRRLRTTGHTLEWLVYALPDDQLRSYQTVRAVNYLTNLLSSHADHEWHLGSIAHALHALVLYDKRVFRPHDADPSAQVVQAVDPTGRLYRDYPIYRGVMRKSPPASAGLFGIFGGSRTGSAASRRR